MDFKEFDKFLEGRIGKIKSVLAAKGDEYNPCGDRLANFKKAALGLDCTPERALIGMAEKHRVSIYDLVRELEKGNIAPSSVWDEKIGDLINYLILLEALLQERRLS